MGNEHDSRPLGAQGPENDEQGFGLGGSQGRSRLVENQYPGQMRQRAADLDQLPLGSRERRNGNGRLEAGAEPHQQRSRARDHGLAIDENATAQLMPEEDIPRRIKRAHEPRVLIDHGDAVRERLRRAGERDGAPVQQKPAGVRLVHAGENAHQRGLAGAVLADDRLNLAGREGERDAFQGLDARKRLHDAFDGENGAGFDHERLANAPDARST